jgi:hypothetical protein
VGCFRQDVAGKWIMGAFGGKLERSFGIWAARLLFIDKLIIHDNTSKEEKASIIKLHKGSAQGEG